MRLKRWPVGALVLSVAMMLAVPARADAPGDAMLDVASPDQADATKAQVKAEKAKKKKKRKKKKNPLQALIDAAEPGSIVELPDGHFEFSLHITVDNLTIEATGTTIYRRMFKGKGAVYIPKDIKAVTIVGLECYGVHGDPGPCIRNHQTTGTLDLRNVYFHDADEGVLGCGGKVTIENSRFETLGRGGRQHGVYVGQDCQQLTVRGSRFVDMRGDGHAIKSGARRTLVEDTDIYCGRVPGELGEDSSAASRPVDAFRGGIVTLRDLRVVIGTSNEKNRPTCAKQVLGYGMEIAKRGGWPDNAIHLENLAVTCLDRKGWIIRANPPARASLAALGQTVAVFDPDRPVDGETPIIHQNGVAMENCTGLIQQK